MEKNNRSVRLAYLVTHPIQYQVPLLRQISKSSNLKLTVFFRSDFSSKSFFDSGFGIKVKWDLNLLSGYRYEVLPIFGPVDKFTFWRPLNYGLWKRLEKGRFDVLWIHGYAHYFHLYAMVVAKLLGIKVLIRDEATQISKKRGTLRKAAKKAFFLLINMLTDGFLAIGEMNKAYYALNGIPEKKIFKMPYAVDNDYFKKKIEICRSNREILRASLGLSPGRPVVLYASKLIERKRPLDMLKAFNQVAKTLMPRPYLLLIGDGEMRNQLENKVTKMMLEKDVLFLGFINQRELPKFYDFCDLFILPSVCEPWGLVINEAMNAGRAVIACDQVGSATDLIHPGVNGYVFKAADIAGLAKIMTDVLSDPSRCKAMGKKSLEIISQYNFGEDIKGLNSAINNIM